MWGDSPTLHIGNNSSHESWSVSTPVMVLDVVDQTVNGPKSSQMEVELLM